MKYRGFCGPSYQSQAITADGERLVNWYVERLESPGASAKTALYPIPGMTAIHTTVGTHGRAHEYYDGREFAVVDNIFFELDSSYNATFHGFVATDGQPATISWNGDGGGQLFITSGGNGYLFVLATNTFSTISALTGKATMGDMIDGYFLALDADTGTFYASDLLDGATWTTGTMFAQRIAAPDPWVAMKVRGGLIYLLGAETGEVWFNNGDSPFPFAKHPSGLLEHGISAPWSIKVAGNSLMWLGGTRAGRGAVLRATAFTPENVATYPVQYAISQYTSVSDAYADSYEESGHTFYVVGFLKANRTWVYDLEMQMWHERGTWDTTGANTDFAVWRPRCHAYAFGKHLWLDTKGGGVYVASVLVGTDVDSLPIRRLRVGPPIVSENKRVYYPAFEVDLESGLGLTSGQGSDPQVMMRLSNDGGRTWSTERMRSAGKTGAYGQRVRWERCGMGRRRVFEVSVTDPIPWRVTDAYLDGISQSGRGEAA